MKRALPVAKARRSPSALWAASLLGTWLVAATLVAMAADGHPPVSLEMEPCVPADADQVRRLVSLELRGALLPRDETAVNATHVVVGCQQERTSLRVDDPLTGKQLQRALPLQTSDPRVRDRLLAISIVELVVASWTELVLEMPSEAARAPGAQDSAQRQKAVQTVERYVPSLRARPAQIGFGTSASLRVQPGGVGLLWQAAGQAVYMVRPDWEIAISVERSEATIDRLPGRTVLSVWAAGLGMFFDPRWSTFSLRAGPMVTIGSANLNPRAEQARVIAQDVGGPVLDVGLFWGGRLHLRRSALLVGLHAAATCVGLRGRVSDAPDVQYRGVMASGALGVEVWP